jgi:hypothetical protein
MQRDQVHVKAHHLHALVEYSLSDDAGSPSAAATNN